LIVVAMLMAACGGFATPSPQPTVGTVGATIRCSADDHAIDDQQLGWGFCYPASWKFRERSQQLDAPPGVDTTFDIIDAARQGPQAGQFGFMVVGTYERGDAKTLQDWLQANLDAAAQPEPISWGNAKEAARVAVNGRRYALTPHHVVSLEVRGATADLDLEGLMAQRLPTWKFSF
jgi:hypothetical protein